MEEKLMRWERTYKEKDPSNTKPVVKKETLSAKTRRKFREYFPAKKDKKKLKDYTLSTEQEKKASPTYLGSAVSAINKRRKMLDDIMNQTR